MEEKERERKRERKGKVKGEEGKEKEKGERDGERKRVCERDSEREKERKRERERENNGCALTRRELLPAQLQSLQLLSEGSQLLLQRRNLFFPPSLQLLATQHEKERGGKEGRGVGKGERRKVWKES